MLNPYQKNVLEQFWDDTYKHKREGLEYLLTALRPDLMQSLCRALMEELRPLIREELETAAARQALAIVNDPAFSDPEDDGSAAMEHFEKLAESGRVSPKLAHWCTGVACLEVGKYPAALLSIKKVYEADAGVESGLDKFFKGLRHRDQAQFDEGLQDMHMAGTFDALVRERFFRLLRQGA